MSLPWYLGAGSNCLNVFSCSSSTITNPKLEKGKNIHERAPKTILNLEFGFKSSFQISTLSLRLNFEWYTPTASPNTFCNRVII